jgi:hypothetical protein
MISFASAIVPMPGKEYSMKMGNEDMGVPVRAEIVEKVEGWETTIINSEGRRFTCPLRKSREFAREDARRYALGRVVRYISLKKPAKGVSCAAE